MTCTDCGATENITENNYVTCTKCGLMFEYKPKYIQGYATPRLPSRKQYYSRIKRFAKKLLDMRCNVIGNNTERILLFYGLLEFAWNVSTKRTRKYFFSQKVVLFFILKALEISLEVPVLKNKERTEEQLLRMDEILRAPGLIGKFQ